MVLRQSQSETTHAHQGNAERLELFLPPEDADQILSPEHKALHDDLRRGWHVKRTLAEVRQMRIAQAMAEAKPLDNVFGRLTLVVDPVLYEEARRRYGPDCWKDPDFRKAVARDNRAMALRSSSGKTTIVRP